jgi:hypothetical protein
MTNIFPSKAEYNHIILQMNLHALDLQFPNRPMRSTKNCPAIDQSIAINVLDKPGLDKMGSSTSVTGMKEK